MPSGGERRGERAHASVSAGLMAVRALIACARTAHKVEDDGGAYASVLESAFAQPPGGHRACHMSTKYTRYTY
jgi:hypothetical protein